MTNTGNGKGAGNLHLFKFDKCASEEWVIDALTAALQYARTHKVLKIEISMFSEAGHWYDPGFKPPTLD